eukprot:TRINITY_DN16_c0_g1_i1.p1 TRINITY_DN16_c0_g1~~TRINITY_DN16_c0_g1_i1.p1  ORF type:complete len:221 (+),score=67.93 TRINITY_DN16_c0_g1_i1:55-717(+)
MSRLSFTILLLLIFSVINLSFCNRALTLQVEPKSQECFYKDFDIGKDVKVSYSVVRGGLLDINFRVKYEGDPSNNNAAKGQIVYETLHFENKAEGFYQFKTLESGVYSFCFDNEMARFTAKVVSFKILGQDRFGSEVLERDDDDLSEHFDPMERSARKISDELELLEMHQEYMIQRELRHSMTQNNTNSRIFWFSFLECTVLIGMSLFQIYYIKKFFELK